ncbi:MAG: type II toxin-antitoxin system Phd/YefM family antitoxin [Streptosporangiaceae bacterium]
MREKVSDNSLSIRELQRNAADVMTRVEHGTSYVITRHGRTVGRLLPPEPGDEAINQAIAEGILDAGDLAHARTAAQVARITPEPTADLGGRPASDALAELRGDEP